VAGRSFISGETQASGIAGSLYLDRRLTSWHALSQNLTSTDLTSTDVCFRQSNLREVRMSCQAKERLAYFPACSLHNIVHAACHAGLRM
jgi:hypothetical protein